MTLYHAHSQQRSWGMPIGGFGNHRGSENVNPSSMLPLVREAGGQIAQCSRMKNCTDPASKELRWKLAMVSVKHR